MIIVENFITSEKKIVTLEVGSVTSWTRFATSIAEICNVRGKAQYLRDKIYYLRYMICYLKGNIRYLRAIICQIRISSMKIWSVRECVTISKNLSLANWRPHTHTNEIEFSQVSATLYTFIKKL